MRNLQLQIKNQLVDDPVVAATEFNPFLKKIQHQLHRNIIF